MEEAAGRIEEGRDIVGVACVVGLDSGYVQVGNH